MTSSEVKPAVWVIVVNFDSYDDTADCLESLEAVTYLNLTIVVVDNGSGDGSGSRLRERFSGIRYIRSEENLGFAGGANLGIRAALDEDAQFICLLNNDTLVEPGFIEPLVEGAAEVKDAGIIGGKIYYADTPGLLWFAGGRIDHRSGFTSHYGQDVPDGPVFSRPRYVDYVTGCLFFVRAELFRDLGMLDERLFMYAEELEFCLRARRGGFRCYYEPRSVIRHRVSRSMGSAYRPVYYYYLTRNLLEVYSGHLAIGRFSVSTSRLAWHLVAGQSYIMLRAHRMDAGRFIAATLFGFLDFMTGRLGRCRHKWLENNGDKS